VGSVDLVLMNSVVGVNVCDGVVISSVRNDV